MSARRDWASLWGMLGNVDAVHGLYYALLHLWIDLVGDSPFAVRLPSGIAVGAASAGVYVLVRRRADRGTAVIAAILFLVLPRVLFVAIEARSMAVATAAATWLTVLLLRLLDAPARRAWWIVYAFGLAAATYLFLFVILLIPVHAVVVLADRRAERRAGHRRVAPRLVRRRLGGRPPGRGADRPRRGAAARADRVPRGTAGRHTRGRRRRPVVHAGTVRPRGLVAHRRGMHRDGRTSSRPRVARAPATPAPRGGVDAPADTGTARGDGPRLSGVHAAVSRGRRARRRDRHGDRGGRGPVDLGPGRRDGTRGGHRRARIRRAAPSVREARGHRLAGGGRHRRPVDRAGRRHRLRRIRAPFTPRPACHARVSRRIRRTRRSRPAAPVRPNRWPLGRDDAACRRPRPAARPGARPRRHAQRTRRRRRPRQFSVRPDSSRPIAWNSSRTS